MEMSAETYADQYTDLSLSTRARGNLRTVFFATSLLCIVSAGMRRWVGTKGPLNMVQERIRSVTIPVNLRMTANCSLEYSTKVF